MKKFIICIVTVSVLLVFQIVATCGTLAKNAETVAVDNAKYCSDRIADKVEETLNLLTSLSNEGVFQNKDFFENPEYDKKSEAARLTKISKRFGYMMIRMLDKNFSVYNENAASDSGISSDLSSREYLQTLKATLEPQVTDAFPAGADGKTENFTIAVPILVDGELNGALFAAIYETDFAKLLSSNDTILLGKGAQYMSGIDVEKMGTMLVSELDKVWLWGGSSETRVQEIVQREKLNNRFWGMRGINPTVYAYNDVENTGWNVVCRASFFNMIAANPIMFVMMMFSIAASGFLLVLTLLNRRWFYKIATEENAHDDEDTGSTFTF